MSFEEFLKALQPDLTILAALFGTLLLSIRLFWFFFNFEKEIQNDNIERVKQLNLNFRKKHIEKRFEKLYVDLKTNGYKWGVSSIIERIFPSKFDTTTSQQTRSLLTPEEIEGILAEDNTTAVKNDVEKEALGFAFSDDGQSFFTTLDILYSKKQRINTEYKRSKYLCRFVSICCLSISILSILGMVIQPLQTSKALVHLWVFTSGSVIIIGLVSLFVLLYYRHTLNDVWENQILYGED